MTMGMGDIHRNVVINIKKLVSEQKTEEFNECTGMKHWTKMLLLNGFIHLIYIRERFIYNIFIYVSYTVSFISASQKCIHIFSTIIFLNVIKNEQSAFVSIKFTLFSVYILYIISSLFIYIK